ncbi:YbaB/EbfC family nucleoid-associated protein [Rhodococcus sovatensis]|uniref:YbaB/EbfC family nucleoid-associated protein n=1 Tax=Rhodococcus sovatensis TaxID=1805840 RepID=A0ABZ2PHF7_9NOCA
MSGLEEITVKAARIQRAVQAVRGSAVSDGGHVRVEVGVDGSMTDIVIGQSFSMLPAETGAELIARTHAAALTAANQAAHGIRRELLEDPRVARLVDQTMTQPNPPGQIPTQPRRTDDYAVAEPLQPTSIYDRW